MWFQGIVMILKFLWNTRTIRMIFIKISMSKFQGKNKNSDHV